MRWLITFLLVLSLASCGDKAVSQDVAVGNRATPQKSFQEFAEVSPPATIQELRSALDIYQPQVAIVTPQADEVLPDNQVTVRFQVKDLPIFKDPKWKLGTHLHVILDNQPHIAVYDLNKPLVFSDLAPGTHSLRVFASRPWDESFKNEGAYAQIKFHILAKTDDNNPEPALPVLTYSSPQGDYGAEPILLDFYLTNAPLHLVSQENSNSGISDWRIRCTINGESFVLDRWQAVYLKGFKPGKNWVKLEFLDNQGNPVKNVFNTTVGLIDYQPKGKDTLSRIVSGELKADDVRGIVDPNYIPKTPPAEPAPSPEPTPETKPTPATEIPETPITEPPILPSPETSPEPQPVVPSPAAPELPEKVTPQLEKPKGGYFQRRSRPTATPSPSVSPTLPQVTPTPAATESPQPQVTPTPVVTEQPQPQVTPTPAVTEAPQPQVTPTVKESPQPQVTPTPTATESPQPQVTPTPMATESPQPQVTPTPTATESPQPEVTPTPAATELPKPQVKQRTRTDLSKYFQRRPRPTPETSPTLAPTPPEIIESPAPQTVPSPEATPTPAAEGESAQE
ncbi:hypothetical protein NIES37_24210 [Tolypothrix tenuis PCC 7101]|uniref:FHA domain containing protein n=1 Tax=Tolypothrix tenuis PCC 7101 TaxID=231146 RepID=A0A1Z4MYP3_9CYAN|nr:hypothetical protein NIES37_24210 [Tolypothrix tenuis PCC 7101]BAZ77610.1 hypothetical protein NIES50_62410 [Aulosira laxa NIES-50]